LAPFNYSVLVIVNYRVTDTIQRYDNQRAKYIMMERRIR